MRRVALQFDKDGNPASDSVTSPKSFKVRAMVVPPPHDVIPVIFVPGIAGSRLRTKVGHEPVWDPPNGALSALGAAYKRKVPDMGALQRLWDPQNTEVDPEGDCAIGDQTYWLTEGEAKRRGWGELHALSYHAFLQKLEKSLNDRSMKPGFEEEDGNFPLPEIGMLQYLKAGSPASSITEADRRANRKRAIKAYGKSGMYGQHPKTDKPDYAKLAKETIAAWGRTPQPLSDEEIKRLSSYYYPVWAYGYNWLDDPELAAKGLIERIETILEHYEKTTYFRHQGKVIVVTHSMGGLIARRAAQIDGSKILGVVHGVCPLVGAAVLYRRLRSGQEGGGIAEDVVAAVMGSTQADMTVQLGRSPGAFTLAPTKDYESYWLKCCMTDKGTYENMAFSLPHSDPYTEIYAKTTDDVWWGMVDPRLIDPLRVMTGEEGKDTPVKA
jgi:pimeloyl-ACP methyl ester carboxylesterase